MNLFHSFFLQFWQPLTEICFAQSFPVLLDSNEKVLSYIQKFRAKSSNFTPKSHWEHTNCSYHPNSLSLQFSGSHGSSWRTEGQSSPKMTPSTCQMFLAWRNLREHDSFTCGEDSGIQEKLTPSLCQSSSRSWILRMFVPVGHELKNQAQSGRDLEMKITSEFFSLLLYRISMLCWSP